MNASRPAEILHPNLNGTVPLPWPIRQIRDLEIAQLPAFLVLQSEHPRYAAMSVQCRSRPVAIPAEHNGIVRRAGTERSQRHTVPLAAGAEQDAIPGSEGGVIDALQRPPRAFRREPIAAIVS